MLSCKACGAEKADRATIKSHIQMTKEGGHGPQYELPDGWENLVASDDAATSSSSSATSSAQETADRGGEAASSSKPWYEKSLGELAKDLFGIGGGS